MCQNTCIYIHRKSTLILHENNNRFRNTIYIIYHKLYIRQANTHNNSFNHTKCWQNVVLLHDDVIKWKHFPRYWPFVRGIHRSPVNSPHKGQWRGALMFSLICICINGWVNNHEAGDLRRDRAHYDVSVMSHCILWYCTIYPDIIPQFHNVVAQRCPFSTL